MNRILMSCRVNGEDHTCLADPRDTLLELLRERLQLTGTKEGCGNGNCGSCTVLVDGAAVCACLVLAGEAQGVEVTTVEGLAASGGGRHPVQQALIDHGGTQCGFCTPGIIMSAVALLRENPDPTDAEIRHAIAGNICRCTGYEKIVRAIASAAAEIRS
ncbi:MAG: (2Fe-2S)-binding protein [Alphaproteobacteria bacterium]|nr:(2Fe-2S)-binding protein [Alphaproteobacteria bacterium]